MNEAPNEGERNRFLLTNLAILFVFILALVVLLVAYPIFFAPEAAPVGVASPSLLTTRTPTSTITLTPTITQTPTNTRTPRATFTPTVITVVPSETPTPGDTPTPAGPPTLTPARPVIGNENYRLNRWSDDNANQMVEYMETYPDTLPRQSRGEADRNYYTAYQYAVLAESEALLRYPDAPQADTWSWRRAYNLVRMGDPDAGDAYGELITRALNTSEVDPADLRLWFSAKEPRLHLTASKLAEVPGYLNGYLLEIAGNTVDDRNANGSAFLLLLETPGAFQHQTLASYLSLIQSRQYDAATGDLTGDGIDEVVLFQTDPGEPYPLQLPQVFSLASIPAQELPFNPAQADFQFGMEYANRWAVQTASESPGTLRLETQVFPACPVTIQRNLRWDGTFFNLQETDFRVEPSPVTLSFCRALSEHAITVWGPEAAIQIMEPILPMWPPETQEDGKPFPLDAKDEWRFRLGVYHALAGNPQEAERYLNDLVAQPVIVGSRWVEPAQKFLETYQSGGLYRACVETEICNPRQALQAVVRSFSPDDYSQALTLLRQAGVDLRVSGYFDFDGDEATESWFTVRHRPSDKLEFWILAPESEGIEPIYVGVIESNEPRLEYYDTVERLPEDQKLPVVLLEGGDFAFTIDRDPDTGEAFLTPVELPRLYPDRFNQGVEAAREALFSGEDPEIVQQALLDLQEFPGLLCKGTWSCDRYYYLLGLASELSGDIPTAIDSYLRLWWDYSRSPYTAMARLKLKGTAVQPSATPTRTPLATPGASPTPTVTGTLPTLTPTVTGTPPTATPSPTGGTSTATPSPTPTTATPYQNP